MILTKLVNHEKHEVKIFNVVTNVAQVCMTKAVEEFISNRKMLKVVCLWMAHGNAEDIHL